MHKVTKIDLIRYVTGGFALLGSGFMVYLTYLHYKGAGASVCDFGAELSCSIVNQSIYSELFGIPVSLLGLAYFMTVVLLMLQRKLKQVFQGVILFTIFSLVFSLYLSVIELRVLKSVCLFCESSKGIMLIILGLSVVGLKKSKGKLRIPLVVGVFIAGAVFTGVTYAVQREPAYTPDYTLTAKCLTEKGVSMYSAYWCPSCAKQKRFFGSAFQYIDEIECDPRAEINQSARCIEKGISKTPTWIWDSEGEEVRRISGAQPIDKLAEFFECTQ